jgi:glucan biosynthesis protein C
VRVDVAEPLPTIADADSPARHIVYFDWLKFLVIYGIVFFHTSLPFSYSSWLIESRDRSVVLGAFAAFTFPWGIPLLFLLSGAGEYFGLRSRPVVPFLVRRFLRLGLPLVLGVLLLSPLQSYFVSEAHRSLSGAVEYYPRFLRAMRLDSTPLWVGRYTYHLWFLGYLLAITVVTLPLMEWLRSQGGRRWVARLAALSRRRGGILVFAVPLAVSQLLLRGRFPDYQDWADIASYTIVFLAGYVLIAERDFTAAIQRNIGLTLVLGVVSTAVVGLLILAGGRLSTGSPVIGGLYRLTYGVFWALNIWCWCVNVLYLGARWLTKDSRLVRYGSESALPVYIISHPVIVILGTYIVAWGLPLWPRFLLLTGLSFVVILAIYELVVRRWNPTRFLFGLRPLVRPRVPMDPAEPVSEGGG